MLALLAQEPPAANGDNPPAMAPAAAAASSAPPRRSRTTNSLRLLRGPVHDEQESVIDMTSSPPARRQAGRGGNDARYETFGVTRQPRIPASRFVLDVDAEERGRADGGTPMQDNTEQVLDVASDKEASATPSRSIGSNDSFGFDPASSPVLQDLSESKKMFARMAVTLFVVLEKIVLVVVLIVAEVHYI